MSDKGLRILIVDGQSRLRRMLSRMLSDSGVKVVRQAPHEEAAKEIQEQEAYAPTLPQDEDRCHGALPAMRVPPAAAPGLPVVRVLRRQEAARGRGPVSRHPRRARRDGR